MSDSASKASAVARWRKRGTGGIAVALGVALFVITHIDTPAPYVEWQIPEHPVAKAAYDYAHSIKLPDSVPKAVPFKFCRDSVLGLCFGKATRDEYFDHLCKTEAGNYVFKKVEGVEGLAELRPRVRALEHSSTLSPTVLEDPITNNIDAVLTHFTPDAVGVAFVQPPGGMFDFYDLFDPSSAKLQLVRFYRDMQTDPEGRRTLFRMNQPPIKWILSQRSIEKSTARFGLTFRGLRRDRDREFGVAGSEVILVDLGTSEVLAVKRDFVRSLSPKWSETRINWDNGKTCLRADDATTRTFVYSVLIPKRSE